MCHSLETIPIAMKRQKNLVQPKIPQTPERGLGETEITNLPEKEFKIRVISMLMELQRNIQELWEEDSINKEYSI